MLYEIQVKIGDSQVSTVALDRHWLDGQPVVIRSAGHWVSPTDYKRWLEQDVLPGGIALLRPNKRDIFTRQMRALRAVLYENRTYEQIAVSRFPGEGVNARTLEEAQRYFLDCEAQFGMLNAVGLDTNWGFSDLMEFGIIVTDLAPEDADDVMAVPLRVDGDPVAPGQMWARRRYRVPYETLLSAGSVTAFQTKGVHVAVPRESASLTPFVREEALVELVPEPLLGVGVGGAGRVR